MTPDEVRARLRDRTEIALVDVRPERVFAGGHPLFAVCLPPARLELEVGDRIPRRDVDVVVYGADESDAAAVAERLKELGYSRVSLLDGGLDDWVASGGELFQDVNVPSKAFGELVAEQRETPSLSAEEVHDLLESGADVTVLDVRRFDEYQTMSVPTAVSAPGAELVYRFEAAVPSPATLVVVNCAGRTRGILGTQSLVNLGIPNRVVALRNGTIGWTLAGLSLDQAQTRQASAPPAPPSTYATAARALAERAGVGHPDARDIDDVLESGTRTVYRFDVRTNEEHARGHLTGFRNVPGGQLVQETDHVASVRGALLVLSDDDGIRANVTGSWLAQMGWEVLVVDQRDTPDRVVTEPSSVQAMPRIDLGLDEDAYRRPYVGRTVDPATMQAYLDWEFGLVEQLERDGTHGFAVLGPLPVPARG